MADIKPDLHDYQLHPWLSGFEKLDPEQKVNVIISQLKYTENLMGQITIGLLFTIILMIFAFVLPFILGGNINAGMITSVLKTVTSSK